MLNTPLYGAIEAGGTKFVCAVGSSPADLRNKVRIPTTTPEETLAGVVQYFTEQELLHGKLAAIGIGTFGPAGLNPAASDFGHITTTPKPHWANVDLVGSLRKHFPVPFGFDTDVNAAALGELQPGGAGVGSQSLLYITVGTGIGGGCVIHGRPIHGLIHPEMGHIRLPQAPGDDFAGCCPWHGNCLEGMTSGEAIFQRWGIRGEELPSDHQAWDFAAQYLGTAAANFMLTLSVDRILMGGSVSCKPGLIQKIQAVAAKTLNGYLSHPLAKDQIHQLITLPGQTEPSGLVGALQLAILAGS